ncbi:unnamed protein product [Protopolystoma xenopodis]|uniref:Uncharacterized protein n=1 Tax=Protopolystoma xenopodis TaxID=117903 RepID=A0A3S5FGA4_9PLAT|nr:unnamed protein product [Protopolystoma xenopodis]
MTTVDTGQASRIAQTGYSAHRERLRQQREEQFLAQQLARQQKQQQQSLHSQRQLRQMGGSTVTLSQQQMQHQEQMHQRRIQNMSSSHLSHHHSMSAMNWKQLSRLALIPTEHNFSAPLHFVCADAQTLEACSKMEIYRNGLFSPFAQQPSSLMGGGEAFEEVETITLQPIGRGVQDLSSRTGSMTTLAQAPATATSLVDGK